MAIVGRAKYTHTRARNFEATRREGSAENYISFSALPSRHVASKFRARVCVYFAHPTIAIAKIRDYSQSITSRAAKMSHPLPVCVCCCHEKYVAVDKKQKKSNNDDKQTNKQTYDNNDPSVNKKRKLGLQSLCAQIIS